MADRLPMDEDGSIELVDLLNDRRLRRALALVASDSAGMTTVHSDPFYGVDFDDGPMECPSCGGPLGNDGRCDVGCLDKQEAA